MALQSSAAHVGGCALMLTTLAIALASACVGLFAGALCCAARHSEDAARVQRAAECMRIIRDGIDSLQHSAQCERLRAAGYGDEATIPCCGVCALKADATDALREMGQ